MVGTDFRRTGKHEQEYFKYFCYRWLGLFASDSFVIVVFVMFRKNENNGRERRGKERRKNFKKRRQKQGLR